MNYLLPLPVSNEGTYIKLRTKFQFLSHVIYAYISNAVEQIVNHDRFKVI